MAERLHAQEPHLSVTVDSAHRQVIISGGPFDLPTMPPKMHHEGGAHVMRFEWPVDGALRGFDIAMYDQHGQPLPRHIIHHLIGVNFDRRNIAYPMVERLFGWGAETHPVMLPSGVGVPLSAGQHLGVYASWHNETGHDISNAYVRITLTWVPSADDPIPVLPVYVDVHNVIGGKTSFDVPPGKSTVAYEFTFPVAGELVAVGGHLHDYGTAIRLEDAESGKVLVSLKANRTDDGHVRSVGRFIWGFHESALPVEPHHLYRVVAEYDNPTGKLIPNGGMGHINGAFHPADLSEWPALDTSNPLTKKDLAALPTMIVADGMMQHHGAADHSMGHDAMHHDGHHGDGDHDDATPVADSTGKDPR